MAKIEFPNPLKELLEENDLHAPIRSMADRVGEILADNKLPFFPDYTDHGIDHINSVLKTQVALVPKQVWENSKKDSDPRLLCDADAAVIIGATLLHDIAMHLHPSGFLELVSKDSRFQPLVWFKDNQESHSADLPWHDSWQAYLREAKRFSERQLSDIIGEQSAQVWKFDCLPEDVGQWERNHCLIIGEFIRRHHARLAHEIGIYGFPGIPVGSGEGQFPAMGKESGHSLMRLADLIGLTARSHGTSLRLSKAYIEASSSYPGTPRPMGSAVMYPMALLRVADYFQIDQQRAPAVLLQLHNPQSPISVQEWKKHLAVQHIGPANYPRGKMVTVSNYLSLPLYLQLRDLLAGLQYEMDHSIAVLDEVYGARTELGLDQLKLVTRRIYSNLHSPAFRDSLPYVPKRTEFSADPNLLTLLIEPLYGKQPSVGVRELMQNAVDAVSELEIWCKVHEVAIESLDLADQDGDVLIDFIKKEDDTWILRVQDRGIGMRSDTLQNFFLRAGASFRRSSEWSKEFLDERGQPRVIRAGHFGIGAFAIFLLGPSFKLWTRHVGVDKSMGYMLEASTNSQLIEIRRAEGLPVGTTIEVEISSESAKVLELEEENYSGWDGPGAKIDWFCWDWPKVIKRVIRGSKPEVLKQENVCPIRKGDLPPEWSVIHPNDFDAVFWTFKDYPPLSCNGFRLAEPFKSLSDNNFLWSNVNNIIRPRIAVVDSATNLSLTTQRYDLADQVLPFEDMLLRDILLSYIAHMLVCKPMSQSEALLVHKKHPLVDSFSNYDLDDRIINPFEGSLIHHSVTSEGIVPADPWLYAQLNTESCIVYGALGLDTQSKGILQRFPTSAVQSILDEAGMTKHAVLPWFGYVNDYSSKKSTKITASYILSKLACDGVAALGPTEACHVLISESPDYLLFDSEDRPQKTFLHLIRERRLELDHLRKIHFQDSGKGFIEVQTGTLKTALCLEPLFKVMDSFFTDKRLFQKRNIVYFVAEIRTRRVESPQSMIAKIWHECIGRKAIPFDPAAREALIAHGSKHPELKRHIKAWQQMK